MIMDKQKPQDEGKTNPATFSCHFDLSVYLRIMDPQQRSDQQDGGLTM